MGMTLAEKILAAHSGRNEVSPGELINVKVDLLMANYVTALPEQDRVCARHNELTEAAQIRRNYQTNSIADSDSQRIAAKGHQPWA